MKVNEIFLSIDGEGIRTGQTAVFVRLQHCNLSCSYCDTRYACDNEGDFHEMSIEDILEKVKTYNCPRVTVTGGEPLLYTDRLDLIACLCKDYQVNVETNGSLPIGVLMKKCSNMCNIDENLIITMDWKSISSDMSKHMLHDNLHRLREQDVLKFVVGTTEDLEQMKRIVTTHALKCNIFVSPIFGMIEPSEIVKYVLDNNLHEVRTQVQLHKIIWDPHMRGV